MAKKAKVETAQANGQLRLVCTVIVSSLIVEGMAPDEIHSALYDNLTKREDDIRKQHKDEDVAFKHRVVVVDKGYNTVKEYRFINNKLINNDTEI